LRTIDFNLLPRSARAKKSMQDYGQTLLVSRADQKCDSQSEMIVDRVIRPSLRGSGAEKEAR
jgi:hypothetical protein